jgi:hypothetical protein
LIDELEKKYNEEKKTRLLLESALEHPSSKRKSIGLSPPVSPVRNEQDISKN